MAFTHRGKRLAFDNIANGSATGVEQVVAGSSGAVNEKLVLGTSANTVSVIGGYPARVFETGETSTKQLVKEFLWKTVSAGQVSDRTTDKDPGF